MQTTERFIRPHSQTAYVELWHPKPFNVLTEPEALKDTTLELFDKMGFSLLEENSIWVARIEPGLSLTAQLRQSGFLEHTWPEYEYLSMMAQVCDPEIDLLKLEDFAKEVFKAKRVDFHQDPNQILRRNMQQSYPPKLAS